jgi:hypothetical protein
MEAIKQMLEAIRKVGLPALAMLVALGAIYVMHELIAKLPN